MAQVKYLTGGPVYDPFWAFQNGINGLLSPATGSEFSAGQAPGFEVVFKGSFTVVGGEVTGGTMTGFEVLMGTTKLAVAKGFSVDGAALYDAIQGDEDSVYDLLFNAGPIKFIGSGRDDYWEGGNSNDRINGKDGNDSLWGWDGDDRIKGGDGNDYIVGEAGFDTLRGGPGEDVFSFEVRDIAPLDFDKIKDFKVGEDLIGLLDFTLDLRPGYLDKAQFHKGTAANNDDQIVIYDKKNGSIYVDNDGSGTEDQYLLAKVKAGTKLGADDFFVVPALIF